MPIFGASHPRALMRFILLSFAFVISALSCTTINEAEPIFPAPPDAHTADALALAPNMRSINENVLRPYCTRGCHSGGDGSAGSLDLAADPYSALVNRAAQGLDCGPSGRVRVIPGDPANSLLVLKLDAKRQGLINAVCGDPMPQGELRPAVSQEQVDVVRQWILAGAPPQ